RRKSRGGVAALRRTRRLSRTAARWLFFSSRSHPFENTRSAHAETYTHGNHAVLGAAFPHLGEQSGGELGSSAAEWMAEGNSTSVDIDDLLVQTEVLDYRQRLRGKCLIQLDQADIALFQTGPGESSRYCFDGSDPHDFRCNPANCKCHETGGRIFSEFLD